MYKLSEKIIAFIEEDRIEPYALEQIKLVSELPFIFNHVAVMPDCHAGKGSCVGTVIATKNALVPSTVGVDLGCGVIGVATKLTSKDLPDNLEELRLMIEKAIPLGAGGANQKLSDSSLKRISDLLSSYRKSDIHNDSYFTKHASQWKQQLGSLGSGNHFSEICLDREDKVWVVLHSGSRGIGNRLASSHIKVAQELMDLWHIPLKDRDLAYLPQGTKEFEAYIADMLWSQDYATFNLSLIHI